MKTIFLVSVLLVMVLSGCHKVSINFDGHLEGTLYSNFDHKYRNLPVDVDLESTKLPVVFSVKDKNKTEQLKLTILSIDKKSIVIQGSLMKDPVTLTIKEQNCYSGKANYDFLLCLSDTELKLDVNNSNGEQVVSVILFPFKQQEVIKEEEPRVLTLTTAVETAQNMNFSTRMEFERVVQAKLAVKASQLHLIPQFTMANLSNYSMPLTTILSAVGDLAPFLLPNRWLNISIQKNLTRAEIDSLKLMKLDTASQAEGLFYLYDRDRGFLRFYNDALKNAAVFYNEIRIRESLGQLPVGSTDNISSIINKIKQDRNILKNVIAEDLMAISQTLGFFSPLAVKDATIDNEQNPIESPATIDYQSLETIALQRSFELDQLEYLILASKDSKKSKYFTWLDPAGDPNLGLGFALGKQIEISESQVRGLIVNRDQLKSVILQKSRDAVKDYQQALNLYAMAQEGIKIQRRRLNESRINMEAGVKIDLFGLIQIFQDYLGVQIQAESAKANYRIARARIDRLLLTGYYGK